MRNILSTVKTKLEKNAVFVQHRVDFVFKNLQHVIGLLKMNTNEKASLQLPRG
jgi:hypothetical protein